MYGKHFGAISCESCKSFFRRNALKNSDLIICFFAGNCDVNIKTRKSCKKCRLSKCLAAGMKSKLFQCFQPKGTTKPIAKNVRQRTDSRQVITTYDDHSSASYNTSNSSHDCLNHDIIDYNVSQHVLENNNLDDSIISPNNTLMSVAPIIRPISDYNNIFNELEGNRLTELLSALKIIEYPIIAENKSLINSNILINECMDALNIMNKINENIFKDTVKLCKTLNAFQYVCQSDQIVLLKYSALEIAVLREVSCFNFEHNSWSIIMNNQLHTIPLDLLRDVPFISRKDSIDLFQCQQTFLQKLGLDWESDALIIDLLTAIILYNPNRPKLINKPFVEFNRKVYIHLLKRYLKMRYRSELLAKEKYTRLLVDLKHLTLLCD
ncbi:unnamed protein product, partial [Medioppia subpectinata]